MPNNDEDYLNKLLQSVSAKENLEKMNKASKSNLSAEELEEERLSKEVRDAFDKSNTSQKNDIEAFREDENDSLDTYESNDDLKNDENDLHTELDFDDADLSDDESASLIDALDDIMDGYNESGVELNIDEDNDNIDTSDMEISELETDDMEVSDTEVSDTEVSDAEVSDAEVSDAEVSDTGRSESLETTDLEDIIAETEEIDEEEVIDPNDIKDNLSEDDELSDEEKDLKAEEEIDKLLSETDLEEAASLDVSTDDLSGELSDNEIERLVNMDLDNIIEDVTSDSVSVEDLFAEDEEDEKEEGEEDSKEEKKKAKKEKKKNKKAKEKNEAEVLDDLIEEKEKKPGFLSKLKDIFFESLEEEDLEEEDDKSKKHKRRTDENGRILDEIDDETSEDGAAKKGFFAKFKYRLDQWKKKQAEEEALEEEQEAIAAEEAKKAKEEKKAAAKEAKEAKKAAEKDKPKKEKKEKPKKEPKPKKEKKPKPEPQPGDILKIKPVSMILFILFVAGVIVLLLVLMKALNYEYGSSAAKNYFNKGDYASAYRTLDGLSLNESDETLYEQAKTILYVEKQYEAYTLYLKMNDNTEALNSLIKGVMAYDEYCDLANSLGVSEQFEAAYEEILTALEETFSIGEDKAYSLAEMYTSDFTNYYFVIMDYGKAAGTE